MTRSLSPLVRSAALAISLLAPSTAVVRAQSQTADQVMRVHFRMNLPLNGVPDVLKLNFGRLTVNQAYGTRTAELFDCGSLLGTASSSSFGTHVGALNLDPSNSWKTPQSLWNFDNPGIVQNFTPIQNGTIVGIIDFTIATGSVTIPLNQVNLNMLRATGSSGGSVVGPAPTVTEVRIVPRMTGPAPGTAGSVNSYTVTGAVPNMPVWFGFGVKCAPIQIPCSPPVFFDLFNPVVFVPIGADPFGIAVLSLPVTPGVRGATIMTQAIQLIGASCDVTNLIAHTFR